jgi:hypothetical protein
VSDWFDDVVRPWRDRRLLEQKQFEAMRELECERDTQRRLAVRELSRPLEESP